MMKNIKKTIRMSYRHYQKLLKQAVTSGEYCKPNGSINFSQFCLDRLLSQETKIVYIHRIEYLDHLIAQLRKLGQNFNQLMNQIHIEQSQCKKNGMPLDGVLTKYETLSMMYDDLNLGIKDVSDELKKLKKTIEAMQ